MTITYPAVKAVVQILINRGLAPKDASDFMDAVFPLQMRVAWDELRPQLLVRYPKIVQAVERYCQAVSDTSQPTGEQLKLL